MSQNRYWQIINELVTDPEDRLNREIGDEITAQVQAAFEAGEEWAVEVLTRWDRDGAIRDYKSVDKKLNSITLIRRDGRTTRKTVSYSRAKRSADSGDIIGQQLEVVWSMTRPELAALIADLVVQVERGGTAVELFSRLLAAMDRHPACTTVRDAWEADGHDIAEVDLREVEGF